MELSKKKWPTWLQPFLSVEDSDRITQAVYQAEKQTSGEIVPVIVRHSAVTNLFWHQFLSTRARQRLVRQRAELEFYRLQLNSTKGKTGILLFVSLIEKQAVVLADQAISEKLPAETWRDVIQTLLDGFRNKAAAKGFEEAIRKCGEILQQALPAKKENPNELCDRLVIRDE